MCKGSPKLPVLHDYEDTLRIGFGIDPDETKYKQLVEALGTLRSHVFPPARTAAVPLRPTQE